MNGAARALAVSTAVSSTPLSTLSVTDVLAAPVIERASVVVADSVTVTVVVPDVIAVSRNPVVSCTLGVPVALREPDAVAVVLSLRFVERDADTESCADTSELSVTEVELAADTAASSLTVPSVVNVEDAVALTAPLSVAVALALTDGALLAERDGLSETEMVSDVESVTESVDWGLSVAEAVSGLTDAEAVVSEDSPLPL